MVIVKNRVESSASARQNHSVIHDGEESKPLLEEHALEQDHTR